MENVRTGAFFPDCQRRPCFFYARGNCKKGKSCRFRHDYMLKPPGDFATRSFPDTSKSTPIAPFPDAKDFEKELPLSIHKHETSRSTITPLPTYSTSESVQGIDDSRTRESSSLPIERTDNSRKEDPRSGGGTRDSHLTESTGQRSSKRLLLVPIAICFLVPDVTDSTEQPSVSNQTETSSPSEHNPKISTTPSHDRRESISGYADEIVIDDMERDELSKTALSTIKYVFASAENRPVVQTPNTFVKLP